MLPVRDDMPNRFTPLVTYALVALNAFIYLWDRRFEFSPSALIDTAGTHRVVFADLSFRPIEIARIVTGEPNQDMLELGKLFTSLFLHGNLAHLMGNLLFLLVLGKTVEQALGGWRFALYYVFWGLFAAATHVFVDPSSRADVLGASGAIGGVLGAYFLLFPANRITTLILPIFWPLQVPAWGLLAFWFLLQVFVHQPGIANWAHAGGFVGGMAVVLAMGGREKVLASYADEVRSDEKLRLGVTGHA